MLHARQHGRKTRGRQQIAAAYKLIGQQNEILGPRWDRRHRDSVRRQERKPRTTTPARVPFSTGDQN